MSRISVVGLGKLGAAMAAVYASKGHQVVGLDFNEKTISLVKKGLAPVNETGLQALMTKHQFKATTSYSDLRNTDTTFVVVPTPSLENGWFTNEHILTAVRSIGEAIKDKKRYHLVVICSTTMPGSIDGPIRAELEKAADRTLGNKLGLCYSPEFIALGSVIHNMLHPDMVLIGESDKLAGSKLEAIVKTVVSAPVKRMSIVNAELAKIAVNTYVTMKISYANTLAEMCENLPGADAAVVTDAVGLDGRIGRKYLSPGAAFGGPCFPRDTVAFTELAQHLDVPPLLSQATQTINEHQTERLAKLVASKAKQGEIVAILGASYKPFTSVVDESPGLKLAAVLHKAGFAIRVYDPAVHSGKTDYTHSNSWKNCVSGASVAVIMTPWPEFKEVVPECFKENNALLLLDCWGVTDRSPWDETNVLRIGVFH